MAATGIGSLVGSRLGSYDVRAVIGVGGMGEVYRAYDSTLDRDVALKILPDLWLDDADRQARFDREARLLASLNHPNIGAIYGVQEGETSGWSGKALVLELVEGETLADRILRAGLGSRRGLPGEEVATIAAQIIDALEAAHERGIVHRDLKPGNIKITADGRVKVLDFGLARAVGAGSSGVALAHSPTITGPTQNGVPPGTAAYMSPEHARGRTVDKRTDIWAFGCVLYEMLTGRPSFAGDGVSDVLANVIKGEPEWSALPSDTPAALQLCVQRCLQKDVRLRFHDIADVRLAIEGAFAADRTDRDTNRRQFPLALAYAGWGAATLVMLAAATGNWPSRGPTGTDLPETRFDVVAASTASPGSVTISPDGRSVVYAAGFVQPLSLRRFDSDDTRVLTGTEDGKMPFWAPDGQSIGFFAHGVLKRIDLPGGFVRTLADAPQPRGGTWNSDGTIVFGANSVGPLHRVTADGGAAQPASALLAGQTNHRWPYFLPDGRRFLLFSLGRSDVRGIYLGSLDAPDLKRLSDRESAYAFMAPNHLLFARQGALWARKLNPDYTSVEGNLIPVASKVAIQPNAVGNGTFSASTAGSIAYRRSTGVRQLVWLDRTGRTAARVGGPDDADISLGALSRDGLTAAIRRIVDGNIDIWLVETDRGVPRRLTTEPSNNDYPIFSPDGRQVAYVDDGSIDVNQLHVRRADSIGTATPLLESDQNKNPSDWSPDGRYVLYDTQVSDVMALPMFGDRKPLAIASTQFAEAGARFSPDGRWVAFYTNEPGRNEVFVQPFPGVGPKVQVSLGGGQWPRWRRDGSELFYISLDNRLMAVPITFSGGRFDAGAPRPLFPLQPGLGFEPSPDGQRFLTIVSVSEASPISVILNWKAPAR